MQRRHVTARGILVRECARVARGRGPAQPRGRRRDASAPGRIGRGLGYRAGRRLRCVRRNSAWRGRWCMVSRRRASTDGPYRGRLSWDDDQLGTIRRADGCSRHRPGSAVLLAFPVLPALPCFRLRPRFRRTARPWATGETGLRSRRRAGSPTMRRSLQPTSAKSVF